MLEVQVPENLIQVDCLRILCPDVVLERVLKLGPFGVSNFEAFRLCQRHLGFTDGA